jgi:hypothetical protein
MVVPFNPNDEDVVNSCTLYLQTSIKCYCGDTSAVVHICTHMLLLFLSYVICVCRAYYLYICVDFVKFVGHTKR